MNASQYAYNKFSAFFYNLLLVTLLAHKVSLAHAVSSTNMLTTYWNDNLQGSMGIVNVAQCTAKISIELGRK